MSVVIDDLLDEYETAEFWHRYAADFRYEAAAAQDDEPEDTAGRWQALPDGLEDEPAYPLDGLRNADTGAPIA
ncbi:MAG TPA: hypothetical protein VGI64_19995 [Streptosporangiaceae bacterium]|jgi:hypothetical protein